MISCQRSHAKPLRLLPYCDKQCRDYGQFFLLPKWLPSSCFWQLLSAVASGTGSQQLLPSARALLWNGSLWQRAHCQNSGAAAGQPILKNSCLPPSSLGAWSLLSEHSFPGLLTAGSTQSPWGHYRVKVFFLRNKFKGAKIKSLSYRTECYLLCGFLWSVYSMLSESWDPPLEL